MLRFSVCSKYKHYALLVNSSGRKTPMQSQGKVTIYPNNDNKYPKAHIQNTVYKHSQALYWHGKHSRHFDWKWQISVITQKKVKKKLLQQMADMYTECITFD